MKFYLGTHHPAWLGRLPVPLFVSRRWLSARKSLPRSAASWALDSGGFTELSLHGEWRVSETAYAAEVTRFASDIGSMDWAAPQDWMCEPVVLKRTGLTVREHQRRTIVSVLGLRSRGIPVAPVIQGWVLGDYERHVNDYARAGIDLCAETVVGVGTICRRESTSEAARIIRSLAAMNIKLHAFGAKVSGLRLYGDRLASADSMAWSFAARARKLRLPGCAHASCANCERWAMLWREQVLAGLTQEPLPLLAGVPALARREAA
jgi:hypothetical protein